MTVSWLSLSVGQVEQAGNQNVAVATSDPSADIALEINLANVTSIRQAVLACEVFKNYLIDRGQGSSGGAGVDLPAN
jgi:hypothetical protein